MRSDPGREPWWAWLRSQGLGVACGLATTLLLAIGSFVVAATRGGASAGLRLDDIRLFFDQPSPAHLWFYLLLPVLGLYGVNTALATWRSVTLKWRNGLRRPQTYAAAVVHVAFLVALVAHLFGGVGGEERGLLLDGNWQALPDGREIRLISVDIERLPGGAPRTMRAAVEVSRNGVVEPAVIGFNQPLSSRLGAHLVLFQRPVTVPGPTVIGSGGEQCRLRPGQTCRLGGHDVTLGELRHGDARGLLARVTCEGRDSWLLPGLPRRLAEGLSVTLVGLESETGAAATWRRAPGNPWALVSAVLLVLGVALMWRRLV